ncbi:MAG: AEC family transporter [Eubacteriales bacterium]|nr:AEC family transporter [Eubacteriales bacterium]
MDNLIFCLNATFPIFLTMLLGVFFRRIGWMDDAFVAKLNKFVFQAALPALLFEDLAKVDLASVWDMGYVGYCFAATLLGIVLCWLLSLFLKNRAVQGEFVQASYRSSAALMGIAVIQNVYGDAGMAPLMIIGTVPLYNVMAVVILSVLKPSRSKIDGALVKRTLLGIVTNPIILGIAAGCLWSGLRLPLPVMLDKTVTNVGVLATPLGLMALGASFDLKQAVGQLRPALAATFLKLVGLAAIFLPVGAALGYTGEKMVGLLVMLGSASTVSCFIMAKNMGHEGTLTSSVVVLSTLFSAFTMTGWLFLLRTLGLV